MNKRDISALLDDVVVVSSKKQKVSSVPSADRVDLSTSSSTSLSVSPSPPVLTIPATNITQKITFTLPSVAELDAIHKENVQKACTKISKDLSTCLKRDEPFGYNVYCNTNSMYVAYEYIKSYLTTNKQSSLYGKYDWIFEEPKNRFIEPCKISCWKRLETVGISSSILCIDTACIPCVSF